MHEQPLGGVLFGSSVAIPFLLASGLLLGLAPFLASSVDTRSKPPRDREAKDQSSSHIQSASQEAR